MYHAAEEGNLEQVTLLVEQGVDKNQTGGLWGNTALSAAAQNGYIAVVQYLVEQGADMEQSSAKGNGIFNPQYPLHYAVRYHHVNVVRYLLEQGADRDKANTSGHTLLHLAAGSNDLKTAKLLMVYGADLNARDRRGSLPIDWAYSEEMKQAICDEPRRRMDEAPGKRATEQDRHPNTTLSTSVQKEEEGEEHSKVQIADIVDTGSKIAEEDEDSEPSDEEDDDLRATRGTA